MSEESEEGALGFERIVFFSDAVFAIVITLLVLPLTAEFEVTDETVTFAHELLELWPKILTFVISFLVIGQFWMVHHKLFGRIVRFDHTLLVLNLIFLLTVSFMPFPAAVIGAFDINEDPLPMAFYAASLTATSLMLTVLWLVARRRGLVNPSITKNFADDVTAGAITTGAGFAISIGAAFISPLAALFCWLLLIPIARRLVSRLRARA